MKIKSYPQYYRAWLVLLALLVCLHLTAFVYAQSSARKAAGYAIGWWTVDGGGAVPDTSPTGYTLGGSIGQPDAAMWRNGSYTLSGGFWQHTTAGYGIYLPLVVRNF